MLVWASTLHSIGMHWQHWHTGSQSRVNHFNMPIDLCTFLLVLVLSNEWPCDTCTSARYSLIRAFCSSLNLYLNLEKKISKLPLLLLTICSVPNVCTIHSYLCRLYSIFVHILPGGHGVSETLLLRRIIPNRILISAPRMASADLRPACRWSRSTVIKTAAWIGLWAVEVKYTTTRCNVVTRFHFVRSYGINYRSLFFFPVKGKRILVRSATIDNEFNAN